MGTLPDDFIVARNPDPDSTLPYLVRIPLGSDGIVLKTRETWPRTSKVYCHRAEAWPPDAEIVERVATRVCTRRGAAIDLVVDRGREARSQFVLTRAKGREVIFWQTGRTTKQARPNVRVPTARASGSPSGTTDLSAAARPDHRARACVGGSRGTRCQRSGPTATPNLGCLLRPCGGCRPRRRLTPASESARL